jgi:protein SCO1/2
MTATRTSERALLGVLVALLAAIGIVLATGSSGSLSSSSPALPPPLSQWTFPPGVHAANFSLRDQGGRFVTMSQYRGQVVVLTFIHSLCHGTCPFMVEQVKGALNELPRAGAGMPVIGVSVEPAQDTARNRKAFLAKHAMSGRMAFVNGPLQAMRHVWHAYAMQPVRSSKRDDHSTFVVLIDKRGIERVGYPASGLTPDELAQDIRKLEREPA